MKKASPPFSRSNAIILTESIAWIIITFFTRSGLDLLAARWQLAEIWVLLLKIGVVLGLIAIAVALHGVLFRWLAKLGVIPAEEKKG